MAVSIEMPGKRLREAPAARKTAVMSVGARAAHTIASVLKRRYAIKGEHSQNWGGYATKHKRYVSPNYPTSGKKDKTGSYMFKNSRAFHMRMGLKRGTFNVNKASGMWSGLTVLVSSATRSRVEFRGRSEGQGMVWHKPSKEKVRRSQIAKARLKDARFRGEDLKAEEWVAVKGQIIKSPPYWRTNAKGVKVAKGKKVSNALKAWTVKTRARVHILAPTAGEIRGLTVAITAEAVNAINLAHGKDIKGLNAPRNEWVRIMKRAAEMTRTAKDIR